jgi:hypothetical protein
MVIHRRKVDVRLRDDVAQRYVAEAAIGVQPFGGGEDGGTGVIAWHGLRSFVISGWKSFNPGISNRKFPVSGFSPRPPQNDGAILGVAFRTFV